MYFKHDYSYIKPAHTQLICAGYGETSVYSLHFGRYFSDEQKAQNAQLAKTMTSEEWSKHCDEISEALNKPLSEIVGAISQKYDIHQTSPETSTMEHYKSDWDLFFWSNRGWNGHDYMDCFQLSFNDKKTPAVRMQIAKDIVAMLENAEYDNIGCRIQYDAALDEGKIEDAARLIFAKVSDKFVTYNGYVGKIKEIGIQDGHVEYGFFKKNAKNKYFALSGINLLLMELNGEFATVA